MFQGLLETVRGNINTVRSIIQTNEKLREIAFGECERMQNSLSAP